MGAKPPVEWQAPPRQRAVNIGWISRVYEMPGVGGTVIGELVVKARRSDAVVG
jgi:hypothetical protein